ncbi:MAG: hypothetical protein WCA31_03805 [Acidimicrobiales bacterium]
MAKSTSGKWVSRVGAAGGGKTYSKARPSSFYAVIVLIVVLGLALVVFSRYEYQHPTKKVVIQPAIGTTRFAAMSIQDCGVTLPYLTADPTYKGGFIVGSDDVIKVSPVSSADAGNNATVKTFAIEFPGLLATKSELAIPKPTGVANPATTFKNGDVCGPKTKYAGEKGKVVYAYWTSFDQKKPTLTTNPGSIKFVKDLRFTLAFDPPGVTPNAPSAKTVDAMVLDATTSATTTTTSPATTTTVGPATTTTTTSGTTTTTTSGTTTTTKG